MSTPSPAPGRSHRRWILFSAKIAIAIAALTGLAQWAAQIRSGAAPAGIIASRDVVDPVTTGTVGPRAPLPAKTELDQHGLTSLVSQAQGGTPKAAPTKKR